MPEHPRTVLARSELCYENGVIAITTPKIQGSDEVVLVVEMEKGARYRNPSAHCQGDLGTQNDFDTKLFEDI